MPWNRDTAKNRITKSLEDCPQFEVQQFLDYQRSYRAQQLSQNEDQLDVEPPLFRLPKGKAIVVDTVQIYFSIANLDDYKLESGEETELSHEKAMRLLHLYYSVADRVIEGSPAQRVDFHSGRIHAVVIDKDGGGFTRDLLAEAFAFINDFVRVANAANLEIAGNEFETNLRVGVDIGTCVAINNGSGIEQEPMFLGSAANHAAKLAEGRHPGIYLSSRIRDILRMPIGDFASKNIPLSDEDLRTNSARRSENNELIYGEQDRSGYTREIIENWKGEVKRGEMPDLTIPNFQFRYKEPPLRKIDYADLYPSNSIRMPMVSMFADLSGYTDYIDNAVAMGKIKSAVQALYVIRQEFQNVVESDFGGRKVRFIGDCIHSIIAEGSPSATDERKSVSTAVQCAGALHSSFILCKEILGGITSLGLSIGAEIGTTPVSRIGIRGDRSVRVASSMATACSEVMQQECDKNGLKLGPKAFRAAPAALSDILDENGRSLELNYNDVIVCLSVPAIISQNYARAHAPIQNTTSRAHSTKE